MIADVKWILYAVIVLLLGCYIECSAPVAGGNHVTNKTIYVSTSYTSSCGFWGNFRCTRYRSVAELVDVCEEGWSNLEELDDCDYAICNGGVNDTACGGPEIGTCVAPESCTCYNDYYEYVVNGTADCSQCTRINNCETIVCTSSTDQTCEKCEGEYGLTYGMFSYNRQISNGRACERACSWRSGSRCYPGICSDTLFSSCQCVNGLSGVDCSTVTSDPTILENLMTLSDSHSPNPRAEVPANPHGGFPQPATWTGYGMYDTATVSVKGMFPVSLPSASDTPSYISDAGVGIVASKVELSWKRGDALLEDIITVSKDVSSSPEASNFRYEEEIPLTPWKESEHTFQTADSIFFHVELTNGGYVKYYNRDNENAVEEYTLNGKTAVANFTVKFDLTNPSHCSLDPSPCDTAPFVIPELTTSSTISVIWDGWFDDHSGLANYHIKVYKMEVSDGTSDPVILGQIAPISGLPDPNNILANETRQISLELPSPGLYAVSLTVIDAVDHQMTARRFVLFDDNPDVSKSGQLPGILSASPETDYAWIAQVNEAVLVSWEGRYANFDHKHGMWLNPIEKLYSDLDDNDGLITCDGVENVDGIVRVTVGYNLTFDDVVSNIPPIEVPDISQEQYTLQEATKDGQQFDIEICAYDLFNSSACDKLSVLVDSSPPILENLWLSFSEIKEVMVHSDVDMTKMTIEWDSFDITSGIYTMQWRLFHNFTGETVQAGSSFITPQGNTDDHVECEQMYGNSPGGPDCYCTPYSGCFHKHFHVQPQISNNGTDGLHPDEYEGLHDGDYFIEVTATNKAMLSTTKVIQITIDKTAPQQGSVHDGLLGEDEVDFQQDTTLFAHWDGFFDKESGISFYRYAFGESCLSATSFEVSVLTETTTRSATWSAPGDGTYYVTVAAYNQALVPSNPVCSDGVTVGSTPVSVVEVQVDGVVCQAGLMRDNAGTVWLLEKDRVLSMVTEPDESCRTKATLLDDKDISLYPRKIAESGGVQTVPGTMACIKYDGLPEQPICLLSHSLHLDISWSISNDSGPVHSVYVGLASAAGDFPDKLDFTSSLQHMHIRISHPNIASGELFYILVQSVSKASVENIQSVGPFLVDATKPVFAGSIDVVLESGYIVIMWKSDAFIDEEDFALLTYSLAVGLPEYGTEVLEYSQISAIGPCETVVTNKLCTAISTDSLRWDLHSHQSYVVTVKAENSVGLFAKTASNPVVFNRQLPSSGLVFEVSQQNDIFKDIEDIDYQSSTSEIAVKWYGFKHPSLEPEVTICLHEAGTDVELTCKGASGNTSLIFTGLSLTVHKSYYVVVHAALNDDEVVHYSDGVTIVEESTDPTGIVVADGIPCINRTSNTEPETSNMGHHEQNASQDCVDDTEYQASRKTLGVYWRIPEELLPFLPDLQWAIEEKTENEDIWTLYREFEHFTTTSYIRGTGLHLQSGRTYRSALKFCAALHCYNTIYTNGVTVTSNPPLPGRLSVAYNEEAHSMIATMDMFKDPDIADTNDARAAIKSYEWAFEEEGATRRSVTKWKKLTSFNFLSPSEIQFTITTAGLASFSRRWKLAIRGYSYTGLSSEISTDIRDYTKSVNRLPNIVIDAVEEASNSADKNRVLPKAIRHSKNDHWLEEDKDYTPYPNVISAVWPTLRYSKYTVAVIKAGSTDDTLFYHSESDVELSDPCSHPGSVYCTTTGDQYINAFFSGDELLQHGQRFIVCIHADAETIVHEKWMQELDSLSRCSDGITVDLTPPQEGRVWIGNVFGQEDQYQVSTTEMSISWDSFIDIEEMGTSVHASGIQKYEIAIGSSEGNFDALPFTNVGVRNHVIIPNLLLVNGNSYFVKVRATDFVGWTSESTSNAITVDVTPPTKSDRAITIGQRYINHKEALHICWKGVFSDLESGILNYEWAVGSSVGYDDVMGYTRALEQCVETTTLNMEEGHAYFVSVKAFNRVGLVSHAVSWAYVVDSSPPEAGYVFDVSVEDTAVDIDYSDTMVLMVSWAGFYDPHTSINEYFVKVGTTKGNDDILLKQSVGFVQEYSFSNLQLVQSITYYTTVTACNVADLCSTASSDGILFDFSPPLKGIVKDGTGSSDIQFQSSRTFLGAKWFKFTDPESGLSYYEWYVGSSAGNSDILPAMEVHLSNSAVIPNVFEEYSVELPVGQKIYITVKAYNNVGKYVTASSNGFLVDITPPEVLETLTLVDFSTIVDNSLVSRTSFRVQWNVQDLESSIEHQYISLSSHFGGDFHSSSVRLSGVSRVYTFTDLSLHDGSKYDVHLIVCNGAKLCSRTELNDILVDYSSPLSGTFAIKSEHAANLDRQKATWMTWSAAELDLAWFGFSDLHSGIDYYEINVGSRYFGSDMNQAQDEPYLVEHVEDTGDNTIAEGNVQTTKIQTQHLTADDIIYITIWAFNKVGLPSHPVQAQFKLRDGGEMELVRYCPESSCIGHCTCIAGGQKCPANTDTCLDVTNNIGSTASFVGVQDVFDLGFNDDPEQIANSPVNDILAARWDVTNEADNLPIWYEWSVGLSTHNEPKGVFIDATDQIWHEIGMKTRALCTLPPEKQLVSGETYSVFVRAWYDANRYADFKSPGVTIKPYPPQSTNILGKMVKELRPGSENDVDFYQNGEEVVADWEDKFLNAEEDIKSFRLFISISPGGDAFQSSIVDLENTTSRYSLSNMNFQAGVKYFTNIMAVSKSDITTVETSDGFMIDDEAPMSGIVYNGKGPLPVYYQKSAVGIGAHWRGFRDLMSGISRYRWCVRTYSHPDTCDILDWMEFRLRTSAQNDSLQFANGDELVSRVYAIDGAGYTSSIVDSSGLVVDITPPEPVYRTPSEYNLLNNPSFEENSYELHSVQELEALNLCSLPEPTGWFLGSGNCAAAVKITGIQSQDSESWLVLRGEISQSISNQQGGGRYQVTFYSSYLPHSSAKVSSNQGYISVANQTQIFQLHTKAYRHDVASSDGPKLSWQLHKFYFVTNTVEETLTIGTTGGRTGTVFDAISITLLETQDRSGQNDSHILVDIVLVHDWTSIHAGWNFEDPESPITSYMWAVGTMKGGVQIQNFKSVGTAEFAYKEVDRLNHNSEVHVTVVATNAAGLRTVSYSNPVIVDYTPPLITKVNDGTGEDVDFQTLLVISANWKAVDSESGIASCFWAIGTQKGRTDIRNFTVVEAWAMQDSLEMEMSRIGNRTVYSAIKCTNKAGLSSVSSSDGVRILTSGPSVENVALEVLGSSGSRYPVQSHFHGLNNQLRIRWIGFEENVGINTYKVDIDGENFHHSETVPGHVYGYNYVTFNNMDLPEGIVNLSVVAIDALNMHSRRISSQFTLLTSSPLKNPNKNISMQWDANASHLTITWEDVFELDFPLYYEVSVGTSKSSADIIQWQETTNKYMSLSLDPTKFGASGLTVYTTVTAVSPSGTFTTSSANIPRAV